MLNRAALDGLDGAERWVAGVRQGRVLWFGSYTEVDAASRAVDTAAKLARRVTVV